MSSYNDLNTPKIVVVGLISVLITFATVVLLMVIYYQLDKSERVTKDIQLRPTEVTKLVAEQNGRLASYGWVDKDKGIAFIPIQRAMKLTLEEILRDPEAASPKVPVAKPGADSVKTPPRNAESSKTDAPSSPSGSANREAASRGKKEPNHAP